MGLRVLVVGHAYVVGVNQAKLEALAAQGVEVGLLVPRSWRAREWGRRLQLSPPSAAIWTLACATWMTGRVGAHLFPPWRAARAIRDFRPDILQVEQEAASLAALELAWMARRARIPLVVFGWENLDRPLAWFRRPARSYVLQSTALYLAGSQGAERVVRAWGYQGRTAVVPQLGVDPDLFAPSRRQPRPGRLTIGYVGRLTWEKGVDVLLRACQLARRSGAEVAAVLCGAGPEESSLRRLAAELGIDSAVEWVPAVEHERVPEVMARFSVLVLPSRGTPTWQEQFGHVLIEAMSMGIPAIGSDCGAIPEVIGRADLIFPEGDAQALGQLLLRAASDAGWLEDISAYGVERVRAQYSHAAIARKLVAVWQQLVASRPGS